MLRGTLRTRSIYCTLKRQICLANLPFYCSVFITEFGMCCHLFVTSTVSLYANSFVSNTKRSFVLQNFSKLRFCNILTKFPTNYLTICNNWSLLADNKTKPLQTDRRFYALDKCSLTFFHVWLVTKWYSLLYLVSCFPTITQNQMIQFFPVMMKIFRTLSRLFFWRNTLSFPRVA